MIRSKNLRRSCKILGKYELPLMQMVAKFIELKGFSVIPHTRFNVAWSNMLSDVDVMMLKDGLIYVVEIKSHRDKLVRAFKQLDKIKDFVDFIYIATEKFPLTWDQKNIGLLVVNLETRSIKEINRPTRTRSAPRIETIRSFQRKCLVRTLSGSINGKHYKAPYKQQLAEMIQKNTDPILRSYLKEIATCGRDCKNNCPIWSF
jgi:Holliday junction resolvase